MKTRNVFTLTSDVVTMEIFTGDKDNQKLLVSREFALDSIPEVLEDGDNDAKSLKAYGLSRIMQDRCSDYTDGKLADMNLDEQGAANARMEAYVAVFDTLAEGQYRARRQSKAKSSGVDIFFASAFARLLRENGKDVGEQAATLVLQGMTKEQREAFRKDDRVAAYVKEAKAEARDAASGIDLTSLLG